MRIAVNGGFLDIFKNTEESFYITKQVFDVRNLQGRKSDFTRVFNIPRSDNNMILLGLSENERTLNNLIECSISVDEITIIPFGKIAITSLNKNDIEIVIFSGNFDLFSNLSDDFLTELELSSYDFTLTKATIASKVATTSGVVFARHSAYKEEEILDLPTSYWPLFADNTDIKNTGFFFYVKTLLSEIVTQSGFTLDDSGLSGYGCYDELAVYCPLYVALQRDVSTTPKGATAGKTGFYTLNGSSGGGYNTIPFETAISDPDGLFDNVNDRININKTANYKVQLSYNVDVTKNSAAGPSIIRLMRNGTTFLANVAFNSGGTGFTGILEYEGTLFNTDYVTAELFASYQSPGNFDTVKVNTSTTFSTAEQTGSTTNIDVHEWMPDLSQRDLFLFVLKYFNAICEVNAITKKVTFVTWQNLIYDLGKDITDNIIDIKSENNNNPYFKKSLLAYDNDELTTSPDLTINFNSDQTLEDYGQILSFPFSGSDVSFLADTSGSNQNDERIKIPAYRLDVRKEDGFSISNGAANFSFANAVKFRPGDYIVFNGIARRIQIKNTESTGQFYITYTGTTQSSVDCYIITFQENTIKPRIAKINQSKTTGHNLNENGYPDSTPTAVTMYEAEFTNLDMLFISDNYYNEMFTAFQNFKSIEAWMQFNAYELFNIDFKKPVYSKLLNGTFYINKIEQWKINTPCLVELIRTNEFM